MASFLSRSHRAVTRALVFGDGRWASMLNSGGSFFARQSFASATPFVVFFGGRRVLLCHRSSRRFPPASSCHRPLLPRFAAAGKKGVRKRFVAFMVAAMRKIDVRKVMIARLVRRHTNVGLEWIAEELKMGVRSSVTRAEKVLNKKMKQDKNLRGLWGKLEMLQISS